MTPKQKTMEEICDIIHADYQNTGMGLDREMFSKREMRHTHEFLIGALENFKNHGIQKASEGIGESLAGEIWSQPRRADRVR